MSGKGSRGFGRIKYGAGKSLKTLIHVLRISNTILERKGRGGRNNGPHHSIQVNFSKWGNEKVTVAMNIVHRTINFKEKKGTCSGKSRITCKPPHGQCAIEVNHQASWCKYRTIPKAWVKLPVFNRSELKLNRKRKDKNKKQIRKTTNTRIKILRTRSAAQMAISMAPATAWPRDEAPEEAQKLWPVDNKFELAKVKGQHQRTMAIVLILANLTRARMERLVAAVPLSKRSLQAARAELLNSRGQWTPALVNWMGRRHGGNHS